MFRVEDPFLIATADVSRAHFNADAVRNVHVRLPDEDPEVKQPGVCGKLPNVGENTLLRFWRREDFPEAWLLRATSSMKACKHTFWCMVTIFSWWADVRGKHVLSLLRGAYELSKVVTLGPESSQSRTVSSLGRTLTLRQWGIEYEPDQQHVSPALKGFAIDQC